jgi:uncharacterized protein involved in exopolysaccharide biosynthesis
MTERQLIELKEQIEESKTSVSELKGQQTALLRQLKDTFKCSSVEEADKKVEDLRKEIDTLNKQIEEHSKELEEKYEV